MRAGRAKAALLAYRETTGVARKDALSQLMCDLMHFCDRDRRYRSFQKSRERADAQYRGETRDPFSD